MQDDLDSRLMNHGGPEEFKAASERIMARLDDDWARRQTDLRG